MIGKQIIGTSFRSVLDYNERKVKEGVAEFIGSNMLGDNSQMLAKEFEMIRSFKPNVNKAVYHTSLNLAPGENLSNDEFRELAEKYLEKMGFGNSQFVIYRHSDQEHAHIHIIANRIDLDGKVVSDKWNYKRSEKAVRELELEYKLQQVKSSKEARESSLSKGELELLKKTGEVPIKIQLQTMVKEALLFASDKDHLKNILSQMGANLKYHENKSGKVYGVSFELDGICFKGSDLGRAYSWNKINIQLNNERNTTISQGENFRENGNSRSTGRTLAEYEQEEYSGVNRGTSANNIEYQRNNCKPERGSDQSSRRTNSLQKTFASGGGVGNETRSLNKIDEVDSVSSSNSNRFDDRSSNILDSVHQLSNRLGFQEKKSDDDKKKKKQKDKGKEQENSNGMSM